MTTAEQRLFTPGARATPPALTGREREQALLPGCPPPTRVRRGLPWPRWDLRRSHRLLRGSVTGVGSIRPAGRRRARGRPLSIHADADLRAVEVHGCRRPHRERAPGAGADGPDRPSAPGLRLAPARTASAGSLRARNSLADGLRTRPRRPADCYTVIRSRPRKGDGTRQPRFRGAGPGVRCRGVYRQRRTGRGPGAAGGAGDRRPGRYRRTQQSGAHLGIHHHSGRSRHLIRRGVRRSFSASSSRITDRIPGGGLHAGGWVSRPAHGGGCPRLSCLN